jgi:hypothetical protein
VEGEKNENGELERNVRGKKEKIRNWEGGAMKEH